MYGTVKIGEKTVEMAANAATPIYFRWVFHKDLMREYQALVDGKKDELEGADLFNEVGFIMASTAAGRDIRKLTEDDYVEWLTAFDVMDLYEASREIMNIYFAGKVNLSEPKKAGGRQTGRKQ